MALDVQLDTTAGLSQGAENFTLSRPDGTREKIVLHDYARVYAIPGLYEEVVQRLLECASPEVLAESLAKSVSEAGEDFADLRVFDLGAGNGVVGAELAARGAQVLAGCDGIPEARDAARRDRPDLYADYLIGGLDDPALLAGLIEKHQLNALTAAGAIGGGHIPVSVFERIWQLYPAGSWLAITVKDVGGPDPEEVADFLRRAGEESTPTRVIVRERFRHRRSMAGEELFYYVYVAHKA